MVSRNTSVALARQAEPRPRTNSGGSSAHRVGGNRAGSGVRLLTRIADVACSLVAFALAYRMLPLLKIAAAAALSAHPSLASILSPAPPEADLPTLGELSWIWVVVTLAIALTLEYPAEVALNARTVWTVARPVLLGMAVALGSVATVFYALAVPPYSRLFVWSYVAILVTFTAGYRLAAIALKRGRARTGESARRVVIAGTTDGVSRYLSLASRKPGSELEVAGCVLREEVPSVGKVESVPILGGIDRLGDLLIHNPIDEVVAVLPDRDADWLNGVIEHCDYFRVGLQIVHERMIDLELRDLRPASSSGPAPSIHLIPEEELTTATLAWKRAIDVVLSSIALIVLAPFMLAIAAAIKLTTPHLPALYRWNVVGYRGRRFTGYKFTTMVADADDRKAGLATLNEMSGPVFKIRNDPRVTPLGRFLRKYSLNELPQFWSVLKGDMSLVGPRPAGPHELVRYELWHKRKLSVQPGITCFWQVRGRNDIHSFDEWVRMDLEYIQKRSLRTDLTILFRTVSVVIRGTGC